MTDTSTAVRPTKIALKAGENLWKLSRKVFKKFSISLARNFGTVEKDDENSVHRQIRALKIGKNFVELTESAENCLSAEFPSSTIKSRFLSKSLEKEHKFFREISASF